MQYISIFHILYINAIVVIIVGNAIWYCFVVYRCLPNACRPTSCRVIMLCNIDTHLFILQFYINFAGAIYTASTKLMQSIAG